MKILLFGKNGQVGWELNRSLQPLGEIIALARVDADFSRPDSLADIVQQVKPDVIVNAVAYTAVDKAEQEEALALKVNALSPGVLAGQAKKLKALLVHYSTDYVFDGKKESPYDETDEPNPVNAYGRTKLAGEQAIQSSGCDYLIFRTSWVYASRGNNFLLTMLKLAQEREELSIVADQTGSPTSARLIADTTALCVQQSVKEKLSDGFASGLYHLTASGCTSWHGFTEEIIKLAGSCPDFPLKIKQVKGIPTSEYPTPAKRPMNSQLTLTKLENRFGLEMPSWKKSLALCMGNITGDH